MYRVMLSLLAVSCSYGLSADLTGGLEQVARTASVMIDGDLCTHIQTERSVEYMSKKDPRDPWRAADNYDVNAAPFIQIKKTLIRLARLCPTACDVNLWMPVPSHPDRIQIVIRNAHELSQFWKWGDMDQAMPAEMKRVLKSAQLVAVAQKPGIASVLAPVYDSLDNVVALVEVVGQDNPDPRENVK